MKQSFRRATCLFLSMLTAFSLAACGGDKGGTSSSGEKTEKKYDTD